MYMCRRVTGRRQYDVLVMLSSIVGLLVHSPSWNPLPTHLAFVCLCVRIVHAPNLDLWFNYVGTAVVRNLWAINKTVPKWANLLKPIKLWSDGKVRARLWSENERAKMYGSEQIRRKHLITTWLFVRKTLVNVSFSVSKSLECKQSHWWGDPLSINTNYPKQTPFTQNYCLNGTIIAPLLRLHSSNGACLQRAKLILDW